MVIAALVMWFTSDASLAIDPYMAAYLARATDGFAYSSPVAAAAAAWCAGRLTSAGSDDPMRRSLRPIWRQVWPLFAAQGVAFVVIVVVQVTRKTPTTIGSPLVLITAAAIVTTAIVVGCVIGTVLPIPVAIVGSFAVIFAWVSVPPTDGTNLSWRHIAGYSVYTCCDFVPHALDWRAALAPVLPAVASIFALVMLRERRSVSRVGTAACAMVVAVVLATLLCQGTTPDGNTDRVAGENRAPALAHLSSVEQALIATAT